MEDSCRINQLQDEIEDINAATYSKSYADAAHQPMPEDAQSVSCLSFLLESISQLSQLLMNILTGKKGMLINLTI